MHVRSKRRRHTRRRNRFGGLLAVAAFTATAVACGGDDGTPTLTWWINPDVDPPEGQAGIAQRCSTDEYRVETELLPGDASEQRIQLARRLVGGDSSIDLMSLDPVFVGEFAEAGFLAEIPADQQDALSEGALSGALEGATWNDELVAVPLWANTQVLWYRPSVAEAAGLDMSQPVTWDQVIDTAVDQGGTVGIQAGRYEGYVVWINALVMGAGGDIVVDTEEGPNATPTLGTDAGEQAARIVNKLATSPAAQSDMSVSNEGTVLGPFAGDNGAFQLNWTFTYTDGSTDSIRDDDLGWARYPQTIEGEASRPPLGGINVGIGAHTNHLDEALDAVGCITAEQEQVTYAIETGNMPAREGAYDDPELTDAFPTDLLDLYRESIESGGPRPGTPYWGEIVNAVLNRWHPASSVNPGSTPAATDTFITDVLQGRTLS